MTIRAGPDRQAGPLSLDRRRGMALCLVSSGRVPSILPDRASGFRSYKSRPASSLSKPPVSEKCAPRSSRFLVFETSLRLSSTPPFPGFQSELAKLGVVASRVGTSRRRVYNGKQPVHDGQPVAACEAARVVDNLPSDSRSVAGAFPAWPNSDDT